MIKVKNKMKEDKNPVSTLAARRTTLRRLAVHPLSRAEDSLNNVIVKLLNYYDEKEKDL